MRLQAYRNFQFHSSETRFLRQVLGKTSKDDCTMSRLCSHLALSHIKNLDEQTQTIPRQTCIPIHQTFILTGSPQMSSTTPAMLAGLRRRPRRPRRLWHGWHHRGPDQEAPAFCILLDVIHRRSPPLLGLVDSDWEQRVALDVIHHQTKEAPYNQAP